MWFECAAHDRRLAETSARHARLLRPFRPTARLGRAATLVAALGALPFAALVSGALLLSSCHPAGQGRAAAPAADPGAAPAAPALAPVAPEAPEPGPSEVAAEEPASSAKPGRVYRGLATYYSNRLAGRRTASGEVYDPSALTAAHRELAFGTMVRVVRADSGRAVTVRINDRGPFGDDARIIDLSYRAAKRLDMLRAGVVPVTVEVLKRGR